MKPLELCNSSIVLPESNQKGSVWIAIPISWWNNGYLALISQEQQFSRHLWTSWDAHGRLRNTPKAPSVDFLYQPAACNPGYTLRSRIPFLDSDPIPLMCSPNTNLIHPSILEGPFSSVSLVTSSSCGLGELFLKVLCVVGLILSVVVLRCYGREDKKLACFVLNYSIW